MTEQEHPTVRRRTTRTCRYCSLPVIGPAHPSRAHRSCEELHRARTAGQYPKSQPKVPE